MEDIKKELTRIYGSPEAFQMNVALEYRSARDKPYHPSWGYFIDETIEQFSRLYSTWDIILTDSDPYTNSQAMRDDMGNRSLRVFTGGELKPGNPMGEYCGFYGVIPGLPSPFNQKLTVNEIFRAVHDIYGHGGYPPSGPFFSASFGMLGEFYPYETFEGEVSAYLRHKRMYSDKAIPALYSETIGQLCHSYAGFGFVTPQGNKIIEVKL